MDVYTRGNSRDINGSIFIEFNDDYEHVSSDVDYIIENCLQTTDTTSESFKQLKEQFNSIYLFSCSCSVNEKSVLCSQSKNCVHGGNYMSIKYNDKWELVLNSQRKSLDLIYECNEQCTCPISCQNRVVQFGPRKHLQIKDFSHLGKQHGLITLKKIPQGAFICEYAGEIITAQEAKKRYKHNDENQLMNYIMCLREFSMESSDNMELQTFVDPSRLGNIGRYLNHSCEPNCEIYSIRLDGPVPKLGKLKYDFIF